MQVVPSPEYLQVVAVWNKILCNLVDLFWLLRLASSLTEDDVAVNFVADKILEVTLVADEAGLFRMLQIVPVTFCNLAVDSLLDPNDFVNHPTVNQMVNLLSSLLTYSDVFRRTRGRTCTCC